MAALAHTEKSRSAQDLARDYPAVGSPLSATNSPSRSSAEGDSLSELSWSGSPEEQQAVERIQQSRKQLEDEIDVRIVLIFIIIIIIIYVFIDRWERGGRGGGAVRIFSSLGDDRPPRLEKKMREREEQGGKWG